MDKGIKIMFSNKTSSKSLPTALRFAAKLNGVAEGDYIRIKLTVLEVFNLWEWVNALLNIIDKWKSFEIYRNDRLCMESKEYRQLFYALQEIRTCYSYNQDEPKDYEKCNEWWGCNKITSISLSLTGSGKKWFEFGHLEEPGTWVIDKNNLLNAVQTEIAQKYLSICPAFPIDRIQKMIDKLPDSFQITENWNVEYRTEMIEGVLTEVARAIKYRSKEDIQSEIERDFKPDPYEGECPYKKESPQWYDWMIDKNLRDKNLNT